MHYIRFFSDVSLKDIDLVGGKNASLGEMFSGLSKHGIKIPNGFAVTSKAYWDSIKKAGILDELKKIVNDIKIGDVRKLQLNARKARELIEEISLPEQLQEEIVLAYDKLNSGYKSKISVAVRSSATAEDLPSASFAGQHDTYLNINSSKALIEAYKKCLASLFTERAIVYRIENKFNHFKVALSVGVMKMVRSDKAVSGVMFTIDTETGFKDVVLINATYGLGESIVQGLVSPDEFYIHKPTFKQGFRYVLKRKLGTKNMKIVYAKQENAVRKVSTLKKERNRFCITEEEVIKLAEYAIKTEEHYSAQAGHPMFMDIEWAKDAEDGELYLIQARPETVMSRRNVAEFKQYHLREKGELIVSGRAAGSSVASGAARIITSPSQLQKFKDGEVLVADSTSPDWGPILKKASAIVTNQGGRTCHAAIVARELGIPAVVGTETATDQLRTGNKITVSCAEGETGKVYRGILKVDVKTANLNKTVQTKTKLMINLGTPEPAFTYSHLPCDGVGLARMEFIINQAIGIHPMALINLHRIKDKNVARKIKNTVKNFSTPQEYFIEKLAQGVGMIAAAFYPRPVIVRMSDFKSNEYANLLGGEEFEPIENNPMLGLRGASRYSHSIYQQGFELECRAMKMLREKAGLTNIALMVPFCRTVKEAEKVIKVMKENGLRRGKDDLNIYIMCEIPNNAIQIDEFLRHYDGISIGSNDLTQLVLGVDRDSELVAFDFDERDEGVKKMIQMAIEGTKRANKYSGICGQAPSDYPEMAEFLINAGIESISVNPDKFISLQSKIAKIESTLN